MSLPDIVTNAANLAAPGGTRTNAARTILWGTLLAGSLDISAAILSWSLRGVPAIRVLQGVAGGVLGRDAVDGGAWTAALGLLLHFLIMSVIVATFYVASTRLPLLAKRWLVFGPAYGIAVYIVMTFVIVPLSASPSGGVPPLPRLALGVLVHIGCVGLPIAFITRRYSYRAQ